MGDKAHDILCSQILTDKEKKNYENSEEEVWRLLCQMS